MLAGSQYDKSLALQPLRRDQILKIDWSNTMQLMPESDPILALYCV